MIIWGIDPSSKCGLAIWDSKRDLSSAHCEVIENKVEADYYWYAAQMGRRLRARVNEYGRPDIVVIEQGSESTQGTGVHGIIWSWNVIGSIMSLMGVYGMPIATITPGRWRKPFYGVGFIPPQDPVMERVTVNGQKVSRQVIEKGKPKFQNNWKAAAVNKCTDLGVTFPPQKTISHNACEAVGIAHSWAHASIINQEYRPAFQTMLQQRNERAPTDLFQGSAA
jgi:hypothetical protein